MRRLFLLTPSVLALAACAEAPVAFSLKSELYAETRGVALRDGHGASVGMADQICQIDVLSGAVAGDSDPSVRSERVLDGLGDRVLVADGARLFVLPQSAGASPELELGLNALDARLTDRGLVALLSRDGACAVSIGDAPETAWRVDGLDCSETVAFSVDRQNARTFLANGEILVRLDADGTTTSFEAPGIDALAWDAPSGLLAVGSLGGDTLAAVTADGLSRWSVTLEGTLVDVVSGGPHGILAASIATAEGGTIALFNASTGELTATFEVPSAPDLTFSEDGGTLAVITADAVRFYEVQTSLDAINDPGVVSPPQPTPVLTSLGVVGGAAVVAALIVD